MLKYLPYVIVLLISACSNQIESAKDGYTIKKRYYKNGNIQAEASFKDGKKDGPTRTYYDSGKVRSELQFVEGKKDGVQKSYYQSGEISSEMTYVNGKKHGSYTKYYKNGIKYTVSNYHEGKLDSVRTVFARSGKRKSEMTYRKGDALPGAKQFKPNGDMRNPNSIVFTLENKTALTGKARLYFRLEEKMNDVVFKLGTIDKQGNYNEEYGYPLPTDGKGRAYLEYQKPEFGMVIHKVEIVATAKDHDQQVYLISGVYNLVLD